MEMIIALVAALSLSAIPLVLGWRRTLTEAQIAKQMGIANKKRTFDPDKLAKQTGTGLSWNQIVFGSLVWVVGGFVAGLLIGPLVAVLFCIAGTLLYWGMLSERRQEFRLNQAKDLLRGLGILEVMLGKGGALEESIKIAADGVGLDGRVVLADLYSKMRAGSASEIPQAIQAWSLTWDNPAVDIIATCLRASQETKNPLAPLISTLRITLTAVIEVLSKARAASKGVEWQARFLALFPPLVLVIIGITTPDAGQMYANNPILLLPIVLGSGLSYYFSMRMIRDGLSMEASMGMQTGEAGEIRVDRMGNVL
jgi:Flp pilus assembly protein TadB